MQLRLRLNEAADAGAAASRAAEDADGETAALSHANSAAVRFYNWGRLAEWVPVCVRHWHNRRRSNIKPA